MRWLVTGAGGTLGRDAVAYLNEQREQVTSLTRADLDITNEEAAYEAVAGHDIVLNCAAWTAVDEAESHEAEAFAVNAVGPALLARSAARQGARLVQVSTDYVFGGQATTPYTSEAVLGPRTAYGRTKASGEWAVRAELPAGYLILRTAWLYGGNGPCFPKTIARVAAEKGSVEVVGDQIGQPTWTRDVAAFAFRLVTADARPGIYHATSAGSASWFEFAQEICKSKGLAADVVRPIRSAELRRPAPRPAYSVLDHDASESIGIDSIGDWRERWRVAADSVLS